MNSNGLLNTLICYHDKHILVWGLKSITQCEVCYVCYTVTEINPVSKCNNFGILESWNDTISHFFKKVDYFGVSNEWQ